MDEAYFKEFEDSIFIIESRTALKRNIVKAVLIDLGLLFAYGMFTFWIPLAFESGFVSITYIVITLALDAALLYFLIKKEYKKYTAFINQFYEMEPRNYSDLCTQAMNAEFKFKSFCLLDDYFYVPSSMLLIKYSDIQDAKTIYHRTNWIYDGAQFVVYTFAGKKLTIQVKQFVLFKNEHDNFIYQLNEKRSLSLQKASV